MVKVRLTRNKARFIWRIRTGRTRLAKWALKHLNGVDGHYVGDECWIEFTKFIDSFDQIKKQQK